MLNKKIETGRSLLETLAVLVVIAILLLAGVAGYNFTIHKYKKDQTVKAISELAVRYKLHPISKTGSIEIKSIYPEADRADAVNMKTADTDTGRVRLEVSKDTSYFAVVVNNILDDSCKEYLEKGEYDAALLLNGAKYDSKTDTEYLAFGKDFLKDFDFDKLTEEQKDKLRALTNGNTSKEAVINVICSGEPKMKTAAFVFGDKCPKRGASHYYEGKCWPCPHNQKEDKYGVCCDESRVNSKEYCYSCGCPNGTHCDGNGPDATGQCVECTEDNHCSGRSDGKIECDTTAHKCVECVTPGEKCAGEPERYCMKNHTCQDCDTTKHLFWNRDLDICECAKPLIGLGEACEDGCCADGLACHDGACMGCWADYDSEKPTKEGSCKADRPLCKDGLCQGCPTTPSVVGAVCYPLCGCDASKGLACQEGTCQCTDPDKPYWSNTLQECTGCTNDADCSGNPDGKTSCNTMTGVCECPSGTYPDADGKCLKCEPSTQNGCVAPLPWCKAATVESKTCVECLRSEHCADRADGKSVCGANNQCECPADMYPNAYGICVECLNDGHCIGRTDGKTICNTTDEVCVECLSDAHCAGRTDGKTICNTENNTCTDCPADAPYKVGGQCLQCEPKTQNGCSGFLPWCKSATQTSKDCKECFVADGVTYGCNVDERTLCNESADSGNGACVCPDGKFWNGSNCVDCLLHYGENGEGACGEDAPVCDKNGTWTCSACQNGKYWNTEAGKCTTCLVDHGKGNGACPTEEEPVCDKNGEDDWTCVSCPENTTWDGTNCKSDQVCTSLYQYNAKRTAGQGKLQGECCEPDQRLITGTANVLFKGYKMDSSNTKQYGCCPVDKVAGQTCCAKNQTPVSGKCCATSKIYTEKGVQKCCNGTVYNGGTACCPSGKYLSGNQCLCPPATQSCRVRGGVGKDGSARPFCHVNSYPGVTYSVSATIRNTHLGSLGINKKCLTGPTVGLYDGWMTCLPNSSGRDIRGTFNVGTTSSSDIPVEVYANHGGPYDITLNLSRIGQCQ